MIMVESSEESCQANPDKFKPRAIHSSTLFPEIVCDVFELISLCSHSGNERKRKYNELHTKNLFLNIHKLRAFHFTLKMSLQGTYQDRQ